MRVLILSQYYHPEPVPKPVTLAEALKSLGHEVVVLTGLPSYPTGKLYENYKLRPFQRELIGGIEVLRVFEFPYHGTNVLGRMLNYGTFMAMAPVGSLFLPPFDVIYVWHPPLTIGVAAWLISKLRGRPFVYDVQDIWPEEAVLSGMLRDGLLVRTMSRLERFVYRRADHLFVVTEGARANLIGKGVEPEKLSVMPHWIDEHVFIDDPGDARNEIRSRYGWTDRFVVMFAGNVGLVQGLDSAIEAMRQVELEDPLLVIVGDGTDRARLQLLVSTLELEHRVHFIERQPMEQMPGLMAAADALLVHLKRSQLSHYVIPTKTIAYLAAAKPIIMAMDGAAADLVGASGAGVVVEPECASSLARAVDSLALTSHAERQSMGGRGRNYLINNFTKERVLPLYEEILARVARRGMVAGE